MLRSTYKEQAKGTLALTDCIGIDIGVKDFPYFYFHQTML